MPLFAQHEGERQVIQISLEFAGESRRELARLEREMPRTFRAAQGGAASKAQNQLRKIMRLGGGWHGVPTFAPRHQMTLLLRPGSQAGGKLADKERIVKFKRGDGQVIGWPDGLAEWASGYQGAARYEFTPQQRRMLHARNRALNGFSIPAYYDRPARAVIGPFAAELQREFPQMLLEKLDERIRSMIKKGKDIL